MDHKSRSKTNQARSGCLKKIKLTVYGALFFVFFLYIGFVIIYYLELVRPANQAVCCQTPADHGLAYENVSIPSDEVVLSGWYIPSQNGAAIILLHGLGGTRLSMLDRATILADAGYGVLLYDMRGHGETEHPYRTVGWEDTKDVAAAVAYLQERKEIDAERIGIMGFSLGGQVAIRAAAELEAITAVAADGPGDATAKDFPRETGDDWFSVITVWLVGKGITLRTGIPTPRSVSETVADIAPRPLFLISSGQTGGNIEQRMVGRYFRLAGEPKTLWEIPEAAHGGGLVARPEEYADRLVQFFDEALDK